MNTETKINILALPEVEVSTLYELKMSVDYWKRRRLEALAQVQAAWDMYSDAINNCEPRENIQQFGKYAEIMEAEAERAYLQLDAAKTQLLARLN